MSVFNCRGAKPSDLDEVIALLRAHGLPADDCAEQLKRLFVIEQAGGVVAVGGLELCRERAGAADGQIGLVRSFAVSPERRGMGLAKMLYQRVEAQAREQGLSALYLLTQTAGGFFARYGFTELPRALAPVALRQTRQFSALCPDTATVMVRYL